MSYAVSRGGTFGVITRAYENAEKKLCYVITWGPWSWKSAFYASDVFICKSTWHTIARVEADVWLKTHYREPT